MNLNVKQSIHAHLQSLLRKKGFLLTFLLLGSNLLLTSCLEKPRAGSRNSRSNGVVSNTASSVNVGYGRILQDNPIILSGNYSLSPTVNLNTLLVSKTDFIKSDGNTLDQSCSISGQSVSLCYNVQLDPNTTKLTNTTRKWAYDANSLEFLQVHTFGHQGKILDRFLSATSSMYTKAQTSLSPGLNYRTAIPNYLLNDYAFWNVKDTTSSPVTHYTLNAYPGCDLEDNAQFVPSEFSLCYGYDEVYTNLKFAQDPTIIYHETGHALVYVMSNARNMVTHLAGGTSVTAPLLRSNLGSVLYDEAGAINEGLADYFSYYVNARTHFAEWALGRLLSASRPMTETDSIHAGRVGSGNHERLAYPEFINYNPNAPTTLVEDIHYAGMMASHFLVALTEDYKNFCSLTHAQASDHVLYLIYETLAELGDLSSRANDFSAVADNKVNLNSNHSFEWASKVHPANFRNFFQTFARYALMTTNVYNPAFCAGSSYPKDRLESLLDNYGLLLFYNYNGDGNGATSGHSGGASNYTVTSSNRLRSVLATKSVLKYDPTPGSFQAFVIDKRSEIKSAVASLTASGQVASSDLSKQIPSDLPYNNGNNAISPGEIVGLALNLYNDSNISLGGVQILANDWDHIKGSVAGGFKPCNTFADAFPLSDEGAADVSTEVTPSVTPGDCGYISRDNGDTTADTMGPICLVQVNDGTSSIWSVQGTLADQLGMPLQNCLSGSSNTRDCFVRALKGADQAYFSRIGPNSTWAKTISPGESSPTFDSSNLIFFEVSPDTPPGTTFDCRFRARFTNCQDCWQDSTSVNNDDYLDYEYSGATPFKLIHFQFTVVD